MKKSAIILFMVIFAMPVFSQVTLINYNGYTGGSPTPQLFPLVSNIDHFTHDVGTNKFVANVYSMNASNVYRFIFRQNGIWKIGDYGFGPDFPGGLSNINLVSTQTSTSINPPCVGNWQTISGAVYQLEFTGMCNNDPVSGQFSELQYNYIQLPRAVTVVINQIPNPQNGMMIYDLTSNCVRVYTNGIWKCLSFQ